LNLWKSGRLPGNLRTRQDNSSGAGGFGFVLRIRVARQVPTADTRLATILMPARLLDQSAADLCLNGDIERAESAVEIFGPIRFAHEADMLCALEYFADVLRTSAGRH
jgi:hypothetical protein